MAIKIRRIRPSGTQIDEIASRILLGDGHGLQQNASGVVELLSGAWIEIRAEGLEVDGSTDEADEVNEIIDYLDTKGGGVLFHREGILVASQILMRAKVALIGSGYNSVIKQTANQHTQIDSGTSSGSNGTLDLRDSSQAWTANEHVQRTCQITGGTGSGQTRMIVSNTTTKLAFDEPWDTTPDATSTYKILEPTALIGLATTGEDLTLLHRLYLDGNKANQTAQNPGVRLKHPTAGGDNEFDVHHVLDDLWIKDCSASGLWVGKGVREARFKNLKLDNNHRFGAEGEHEGGTDLWWLHCTAWNSGMAGFYVNNYASHWSFCKAFGNGTRVEDNGAPNSGFHVTGDGMFMNGCNSQENYGNGFRFVNAFHITASDLTSDANGDTGIFLSNVQDSYIQAVVRSSPALLYQTPWAIKTENGPGAGEDTDRCEVHIQAVASELSDGTLDSASEHGPDTWLFVNNRFFGTFWALGREDIETGEDHVIFGKAGPSGAGTSGNPYYALGTDDGAVPSGEISSWDNSTERIYATLDHANARIILGDDASGTAAAIGGDFEPVEDGTQDVGSESFRWDTVFAKVVDASATLKLTPALGTAGKVEFFQDGVLHWLLFSVGDAADDWALARYNNSGVFQGNALVVDRGTGKVDIAGAMEVTGTLTTGGDVVMPIGAWLRLDGDPSGGTFIRSGGAGGETIQMSADGTKVLTLRATAGEFDGYIQGTTANGYVRIRGDSGATGYLQVNDNGTVVAGNHVDPATNGTLRLGGTSSRWDTVYAKVFDGSATVKLTPSSGTAGQLEWYQGGTRHWNMFSAGDAGDDLAIARYNNSGAFVSSAVKLDRSGNNPVWLYVGGSLEQVHVGANDTGESGWRILQVANT